MVETLGKMRARLKYKDYNKSLTKGAVLVYSTKEKFPKLDEYVAKNSDNQKNTTKEFFSNRNRSL